MYIPTLHPAPPLPPAPSPTIAPEAYTLTEIDALAARLEAMRRDIHAQLRAPHGTYLALVAHNEIVALNADLANVRVINAALRPQHRSSTVAAWPTPPLPETVLLAPRDLLGPLGRAIGVLAVAHDTLKQSGGRDAPL